MIMRTLLVPALLLVACSTETRVDVGTSRITKMISLSQDLDILFVIDNSASTSDKQTVFAQNFINFVEALDAFPSGRPNVHIGVVTSTVDIGVQGFSPGCPSPAPNDDGLLQSTPRVDGCTPPTGAFISDIKESSGTRTTNYTGTLDVAFSCIAQVGSTGCGFEAPLEGMKRALDGSRAENAGFLRDDAYLAVVILTDEDDASVADPAVFSLPPDQAGVGDFRLQPLYAYSCDQPISATNPGTYTNCRLREHSYLADVRSYVSFLAGLKDPSQTVVAVISGNPSATISTGPITMPFNQTLALQPTCSAMINGEFAIGRPGNRLDGFRAGFDEFDHGVFQTVCQPDYSAALTAIGQKLFAMMSPCLEGNIDPADRDPNNPGVQPDCTVTENGATIPACAMLADTVVDPAAARPCWWTQVVASCGTASNVSLIIERAVPPAPGTVTKVSCARL